MLQVNNLSVSYGHIRVLKSINFQVKRGEIISVVGANGAGKTTLMKTIAGVLKPADGNIIFQTRDITGLKAHRIIRKGITLVPEGRGILLKMTVRENLEMGVYIRKDKKIEIDIDKQMERFPVLKKRANQIAGALSGGEQQMLAIARGLLSEPSLLLLDEPSMGLAPMITAQIFDIIKQINESGTTILLVEQNVRQALKISHYTFVLELGKIAAQGASAEMIDSPKIREFYLGKK